MFLEFPAHANSRISAGKFEHCSITLCRNLSASQHNLAMLLIILDCVTYKIHHDTFYINRTADQIPVGNSNVVLGDFYFSFLRHFFDYFKNTLFYIMKVKWNLIQHNLTGFQFSHIKNLIDQLQQKVRGIPDLFSAFCQFIYIIMVIIRDLEHPADSIDLCADIMTHSPEEICLGFTGTLCSIQCFFQKLLLSDFSLHNIIYIQESQHNDP